jgi:hypothetical protein
MSIMHSQLSITQLLRVAPQMVSSGFSFHLVSKPGRGKSSLIKQITQKHLDDNLNHIILPDYSMMDIPGYIVPSIDEHKRNRATRTLPVWAELPDGTTVFDHQKGMVFFDEYGQAEVETKKPSAEVILNKRSGNVKLPKGWRVWLASNYSSDRSGVTRDLDHIINRTFVIYLQDDPDALMNWMREEEYPDVFIAYVARRTEKVFMDAPKEQGPWCTPRSFCAAADLLLEFSPDDGVTFPTNDMAVQTLVAGGIGESTASDLMTFIELRHQLPEVKDILNDPDKAKLPSGLDALMIVSQMLSNAIKTDNADPIVKYIRRMPEDVGVTFLKGAAKRDNKLLQTKAVTRWIADNHSLVAAVAALNV